MKQQMSLMSMVTILSEIIQEAGDLENIKPYEYIEITSGYEFKAEGGLDVEVTFDPLSEDEIKALKVSKNLGFVPKPGQVVNVGYTINDIDTQAKKTDYKTLIKILKTVGDIVIDYASKNEDVVVMAVIPANKNAEQYTKKSDPQKFSLYQTILIKNIGKMSGNWNFMRTKYLNLEAIVLFKKQS